MSFTRQEQVRGSRKEWRRVKNERYNKGFDPETSTYPKENQSRATNGVD
jgi:hypothetical protein